MLGVVRFSSVKWLWVSPLHLQDQVQLHNQQNQPEPSHDSDVGPCECLAQRRALARCRRPIDVKVGGLHEQSSRQSAVACVASTPPTSHSDTAFLWLAALTAINAAAMPNTQPNARPLSNEYARNRRVFSCRLRSAAGGDQPVCAQRRARKTDLEDAKEADALKGGDGEAKRGKYVGSVGGYVSADDCGV